MVKKYESNTSGARAMTQNATSMHNSGHSSKRHRLFLLFGITALICIAILSVTIIFISNRTSSASNNIVWNVQSQNISNKDKEDLIDALRRAPQKDLGTEDPDSPVLIGSVATSHLPEWYLLTVIPKLESEGLLILAHKIDGKWVLSTDLSSGFCSGLREAPSDLVGPDPSSFYLGCR